MVIFIQKALRALPVDYFTCRTHLYVACVLFSERTTQANNIQGEHGHRPVPREEDRRPFAPKEDQENDFRNARADGRYPQESAPQVRGEERYDHRQGRDSRDPKERELLDRNHRERDFRGREPRDARDRGGGDREPREFREREHREREPREREYKDRENRDRRGRDEGPDRDQRDVKRDRDGGHREGGPRDGGPRDGGNRDGARGDAKPVEDQEKKELTEEERNKLGFPESRKGRLSCEFLFAFP